MDEPQTRPGRRRQAPLAGDHVGVHLAETLDARGVSVYALAKATGLTQQGLGQVIAGRQAITPRTALLLGRALGTSPEFWLNLQQGYALDAARAELGAALEAVVPLETVGSIHIVGTWEPD